MAKKAKHENRAHALLGASSSKRWLACPPSARLSEQFENKSSEYADEGTFAHEVAELKLKKRLGVIDNDEYNREFKKLAGSKWLNSTLLMHVEEYVTFCVETLSEYRSKDKKAGFFIEKKIDFSRYVPEGFGSNDFGCYSKKVLHIIDLKFGQGVKVEAFENPQLMLYALGAWLDLGFEHSFETVKMTIHQPRLNHVDTFEMAIEELVEWAEGELKEKAEQAYSGEGETVAGEHCTFCPVKPRCSALAKANLELAKMEFQDPRLLTDAQIAEVLGQISLLSTWSKSVSAYALQEALTGKKWEGFKLVEGRSTRRFKDAEVAEAILLMEMTDTEAIYKKSLKGLTDLQAMLGKKTFEAILGPEIIKPMGAPNLVPETDKRPELNDLAKAKSEFDDGYADNEED